MREPLSFVWPHIELDEPLFEEAFVRRWGDDAFLRLRHAGILQQAESADHFLCPLCDDGHAEEVVTWETDAGTRQFAIPCPDNGRVMLSPEQLRQWTVSFDQLVSLLAAGLGLAGEASEIEPRRLWRLGKVSWQGGLRNVLFATGFDSRCLLSPPPDVSKYPGAIVLLPHAKASSVKWSHPTPSAISLPQIASLGSDGVEFDHSLLIPMITEADMIATQAAQTQMNLRELKVLISREVKSIQVHELNDDVLVRAYVQEGSYRKAAEFLSRETGQEITKDKVHRAVQRSGGTTALARGEDSNSIVRTVASQHRDRTKKIHRRPEGKKSQ